MEHATTVPTGADDWAGYPSEVIDEGGYVHRLEARPLGCGGQGAVFRTAERDLAVKLVTDPVLGLPVRDARRRDEFRRRLEQVRTLPLPDLALAQPLALLRPPYVGYVMRLLTDMKPIESLIAPPATAGLADFYRRGGGLRRRLLLLARVALLLGRLHAVPVVYADVSPKNVFVSAAPTADEVWLIDADNLDFLARPGRSLIHTPGYGAPEVVQGRGGATTLSDAYAFGVLAFEVLAQHTPFAGELFESGGWDSDEDYREMALRGELPWVDDPTDARNRTPHGIPRNLILSPLVRGLFEKTFGPGRTDPTNRPGLLEWADLLQQAADLTLTCPACRWSYFVKKQCPLCEAEAPRFLFAEARCWHPDLDQDEFDIAGGAKASASPVGAGEKPRQAAPAGRLALQIRPGERVGIARRFTEPTLARDGFQDALTIAFHERYLSLVVEGGGPYTMVGPGHAATPLTDRFELRLSEVNQGWHLHCGPVTEPHRVLSFGLYGGGAK